MQCCILDSNGTRCKSQVRGVIRVFLDDELYGYDTFGAKWVLLPVCKKHIEMYKQNQPGGEKGIFPTTYQEEPVK